VTDQSAVAGGLAPVRVGLLRAAFPARLRVTKPIPLILQAAVPVAVSAIVSYAAFDILVARMFKANVSGIFAEVARGLSDLGVGTGYVVAAVVLLLATTLLRRHAFLAYFDDPLCRARRFALLLLAALAASGAVVNSVKLLAGRHRPRDLFAAGDYGFDPLGFHHGLDSFPSGHSQTIFVVAMVLAYAMPKRWRSFALAAAAVAATRVVMTNHYLSDVLVGSYVGIAAVLLLAPRLLRKDDSALLG
jgi:membrane-associated phospholipid phosphatase